VESEPVDTDMIRIQDLTKIYPGRLGRKPKVAVNHLSFGIPKGECFGFLGINGAGKTSTLKVLSADLLPTTGDAFLDGKSVLTDQASVRHLIGYCPQFDALIGTLTAWEHLALFARIKAVPEVDVPRFVDNLIHKIGLDKYAHNPCGSYSGGNKRKLSVGLALIGDPKIVFLDEPSTGMDPQSRRFMWDLISGTMANRSVILTSHSMEECQALCTRLGIMVRGQLRCLGSIPHLQARHGNGYQLDFNSNEPQALREFVENTFQGASLIEIHETSLKFKIPKNQSCGQIFRLIEEQKTLLKVEDYSVSDMSLEQIFIQFAGRDVEEEP